MKTMTVGEFKTHFSDVLQQVKGGEKIAVTFGKKKEVVGYFLPELPQHTNRILGILEGKANAVFSDDFKMTDDDFLGL